jgi:purine nucleosidase
MPLSSRWKTDLSSFLLAGLALLMTTSIAPTAAHAADATTVHTLVIDTDPGADDVIALLFAMASPERLKIQALTTVAGNVPLAKTSRNARLACEWAGRPDIRCTPARRAPCNARRSTRPTSTAAKASRASKVFEPAAPLAEGHAVDYLIRTLRAAPEKSVTLSVRRILFRKSLVRGWRFRGCRRTRPSGSLPGSCRRRR